MTSAESLSWGRSIEIFEGPKQENGRTIMSGGVNFVNSKSMIPLHVHLEDNEEYIPQTSGMKILVLPAEEAEKMTDEEIEEAMKALGPTPVGDVVVCKKGYAHALYNTSLSVGGFVFVKYI